MIKVKKIEKYVQKYKYEYSKQYSCIFKSSVYGLGHKFACHFSSLIIIVENPPLFFLILELCLPFLNFAGWHLCDCQQCALVQNSVSGRLRAELMYR